MRSQKPYHPPQKILEKYANVLVNFALRGGRGIKKGDVVRVTCGEFAEPLYIEIQRAILRAGGHMIGNYYPNNDRRAFNPGRDFYEYANDSQLKFFPKKYLKALADTINHSIVIISDVDKEALKGIDPKKILLRGETIRPMRKWLERKENEGRFSWTVGLYGTNAGAHEARIPVQKYWGEIIRACFLNAQNPVREWGKTLKKISVYGNKLNNLSIKKLHIKGSDIDLWLTLGKTRKWIWSTGHNIPSFEIFCSPDWRGTEGWVRFNQPLYHYGNLITGIELHFKNGVVTKTKAKKNEKILTEMVRAKNGDKVGEFSLTDKRFSRITRFMAETLFDENIGGKNGNTHIALGNAYKDGFRGDPKKVSAKGWKDMGFNESSVHTDIISTTPRTVTAFLTNGKEKVIYKNGMFTL